MNPIPKPVMLRRPPGTISSTLPHDTHKNVKISYFVMENTAAFFVK